jgi:DNA polymerase phi
MLPKLAKSINATIEQCSEENSGTLDNQTKKNFNKFVLQLTRVYSNLGVDSPFKPLSS